MIRRALFLIVVLLALASSAFCQGARYDNTATVNVFGVQHVVANATIRVCSAGSTGSPCSPLASIYSNIALNVPLANPFNADANGNYYFFASPTVAYDIQISGTGIATITQTNVTLTCATGCAGLSTNNVFTGNNTHSGIETFNTNAIIANAGITSAGPNALSGGGTTAGSWTHAGLHTFNLGLTSSGPNTLNGGGVFSGTYSGNHTLTGAATFSGLANLNGGGALNGSFSGPTTLTGTANLNGGGALNGSFSGPTTLTGNVTATAGQNILKAYNFNNILYVDGIKYTTLASALAACPASGCMILDAFPETFAADPFASITAPFQVVLIGGPSSAIWITNVGLRIGHNGQTLYGAGPNLTEIQASGTFPINTSVISVGAPGPSGVNGSGVYQLAVDAASVAGSIGIHLDGAQELSGTSNTQVVNAMAAGFEVSSAQGAGADQNRMVLDHIRSACSVSAAATCVPVLIASTAGARVVIRDVTAVTTTPTVTTDCIRSDSSNATVILQDAHVEECTNGFHHTAAGGQFEVDGITGSTTTTTLVTNDSSSAGYQLRQLILNSSTNTLVDTGRSITTTSPFCTAMGIATSFVSCADRAIPFQFPSSLRITPPLGAGSAAQVQLLAGFTPSTPALFVRHSNATDTQINLTNDGQVCFRGGQTGAFVTCIASDTLTAGPRTLQTPNGPSATVMNASFQTAGATTSDVITIQGMTAAGHCPGLAAQNALAATGMAAGTTWLDTPGANVITLHHTNTNGQLFYIGCISN